MFERDDLLGELLHALVEARMLVPEVEGSSGSVLRWNSFVAVRDAARFFKVVELSPKHDANIGERNAHTGWNTRYRAPTVASRPNVCSQVFQQRDLCYCKT